MSDKELIREARRQVGHIEDKSMRERLISDLADALEARQPSESLVCEPRQDSMLLWEGTSSASTPANEYGDADEREAEYKDHAATVAGGPTYAAGVDRLVIDREALIDAIAARHWEEDSGEVEDWGELTQAEKENVIDNYLCPRVADAVIAHLGADTGGQE